LRLISQLDSHRQQFPALTSNTYFNYGGQGPLSMPALQAIQQAYASLDRLGPFSQAANNWAVQVTQQTRQAIATELKVSPVTISLTEDVTVGCNIVLWGMNWQPGDHLLLTDCEHPGIVAAIQEIQRRFGIEVTTCPMQATLNAGDPVACIADRLQPNTRLVVLSHILWNTGQVLPLGEIVAACHRYPSSQGKVRVLVDAAQSVGVLPLDLNALEADFYAFTGHKWWCGPTGVGGLYVRPEVLAELHPTFIGWRSITTDRAGQITGWQPGAQRFEVATSAVPLYAGLQAAIALHHQWGTTLERYQRLCQISQLLWERLSALDGIACLRTVAPPDAGLISFQVKRNPVAATHCQLVEFLERRGLLVRTIASPSCVRAGVHYFTSDSEIEQLIAGILEFHE
jgi:L-cysteine/cystine lyase